MHSSQNVIYTYFIIRNPSLDIHIIKLFLSVADNLLDAAQRNVKRGTNVSSYQCCQ